MPPCTVHAGQGYMVTGLQLGLSCAMLGNADIDGLEWLQLAAVLFLGRMPLDLCCTFKRDAHPLGTDDFTKCCGIWVMVINGLPIPL